MGECLQAPRRLFVVCGRAAPEGLLQRAFAAVGALEGLRLLREKGCCYVRYERASAALKAIETLHGAVLDHQPEGGGRPLRIRLKVLPAEEPGRSRGSNRGSKGSSGRLSGDSGHTGHTAGSLDSQAQQEDPDNVPPWSRLFVVCPRDADGARIAASMGGYGLSKAGLTAYTIMQAKAWPHLTCTSLSPGFIQTNMTDGFGARLTPEQGTVSLIRCLFGEVVSGYYYGSDGLRSPLTVTRDPGTPEYEGEENPDASKYNK